MDPQNLVFFGVNLVPFIIGLVVLLRQESSIPNYILDWLGALLLAAASVLAFTELQALIVGELAWSSIEPRARAELVVKMVTTFLGVLLVVKGYWPTVRDRTMPRSAPAAADMGARHVTKATMVKHRFTGKY